MEKDTFSGAILAWVKGRGAFLKVQAGTGDNLLDCDIREGFTDYCLWSTFRPECIDIDGGSLPHTPAPASRVLRYPLCGASDASPATPRLTSDTSCVILSIPSFPLRRLLNAQ